MSEVKKPWLAEFRVEAILNLPAESERLHYKHPEGRYEAFISNHDGDDDDRTRLVLHILSDASDVEEAAKITEHHAERFLHMLAFVCATPFRVARRIHVMEWTPGVSMREAIVWTEQAPEADALPALSTSLLDTVGLLHTWNASPTYDRALRWFAAGVRAKFAEDQFQYFWFVLELLAGTMEGAEVADKCQKCRTELFCRTCDTVPTHRPFPRQRIEKILSSMGVKDEDASLLFKIRNGLLHGRERDDIDEIVKKQKPESGFIEGVDFIGKLARDALASFLAQHATAPAKPVFLDPSTFISTTVTGAAHIKLGIMGDPSNPRIEDIRLPQVSWVKHADK